MKDEIEIDFKAIYDKFINNWKFIVGCAVLGIAVMIPIRCTINPTETVYVDREVIKEVVETVEVHSPTVDSIELFPSKTAVMFRDVELEWLGSGLNRLVDISVIVEIIDEDAANSFVSSLGGSDEFKSYLKEVIIANYSERSKDISYSDRLDHTEFIAKGKGTNYMDADIWDAFKQVGFQIFHASLY